MTEPSTTYDPEVVELLANIAADERSTLLRVPPRQAFREMMSPAHAVSARMAGLSSLERHLLERHRDELGLLLRTVCYQALGSDSYISDCLIGHESKDTMSPSLAGSDAKLRSHALTESPVLNTYEAGVCTMLSEIVSDPHPRAISVMQLSVAALRVSPSDTSRIYMGLDQFRKRDLQGALHSFGLVLKGSPSDMDASMAWENIGLVRSEQVQFGKALEAFLHSGKTRNDRADPAIGAFLMAIQAGNRAQAVAGSKRLSDTILPSHPAIAHFIAGCMKRRMDGRWKPTVVGVELIRALSSFLDPVSMRLANVML